MSLRLMSSSLWSVAVETVTPPTCDRLELGPRVERAGAPDADVDPPQRRDRGRRRPLERARPARPLVQRAEPLLLVEGVDLDHDPVDLVVELGAARSPTRAGRRRPPRSSRAARRAGSSGSRARAARRASRSASSGDGALVHADAVDPDRERPLGRDRRVELPQRAGRGVARVRRLLLARRDLRLVEAREAGEREVDLAAHLEAAAAAPRRRAARIRSGTASIVRRFAVTSSPRYAVAARRAAHEHAVLVDERDRRAVDLRLDHVGDRLVGAEALAHVVGPLLERLARRHLLERPHRRQVLDLA